jgi:hypothetical protein
MNNTKATLETSKTEKMRRQVTNCRIQDSKGQAGHISRWLAAISKLEWHVRGSPPSSSDHENIIVQ